MESINKNLKIPLITLCLSIFSICIWRAVVFYINNTGIKLEFNSFLSSIVLECIILFVSYSVVKKYNNDKFKLELIGIDKNVNIRKHIMVGLAAGLIMFAAYKLILFIMKIEIFKGVGFKSYTVNEVIGSIVTALILSAIAGISEEVFCRGVVFNYLTKFNGENFALIISSVIFTLLHVSQYENFIQLAEVLIFGFALGYCYILSKSLFLPIALHFAWNFYNSLTSVNCLGLFVFSINKKLSPAYCSHIIMVAQSIIEIGVSILLICIDMKRKEKFGVDESVKE